MLIKLSFFEQEVLGNVEDDLVLAANCCLIIAWKLRDQSFSFSDFMVNY